MNATRIREQHEERRAELARRYLAGESMVAIAQVMGYSSGTAAINAVRRLRKDYGYNLPLRRTVKR